MIVQNNNGDWVASCELCQWNTYVPKRNSAENMLRNHINVVHKTGVNNITHKKRPAAKQNMPRQTPGPIRRF